MDTLTVLERTLLNIRHIISKYNTELDDADLYSLLKLEQELSRIV